MTEADHLLLAAAEDLIRRHYSPGRHHVAAALRIASGQVFMGLHLDSAAVDICAEAVALGAAAVQGEKAVQTVVAVQLVGGAPTVLPPCGSCRELFQTFAADARAILRIDGNLVKVPFSELLPCSYTSVRTEIKNGFQADPRHSPTPG